MAITSLSNESELPVLNSPDGLKRCLQDWFAAQWQKLRPGSPPVIVFDKPLEGAPFYLDSLELLTLASRAADFFCIRDSGLEDWFLARRTLDEWLELIRTSWQRASQPALAFASSGTSGSPQVFRHALALLQEEADFFCREWGGFQRVLQTVPAHHIYGFLFTVLLPARAGVPVVEIQPEAPAWQPGDLLVTHPVHLGLWQARGLRIPSGVTVVTSTSALSGPLWAWLEGQDLSVREIFGSSETAGLGFRQHAHEPFSLLPYWEVLPGDPPETALVRPGLEAAVAPPRPPGMGGTPCVPAGRPAGQGPQDRRPAGLARQRPGCPEGASGSGGRPGTGAGNRGRPAAEGLYCPGCASD